MEYRKSSTFRLASASLFSFGGSVWTKFEQAQNREKHSMAEEAGFEPAVGFSLRWFSRPVP